MNVNDVRRTGRKGRLTGSFSFIAKEKSVQRARVCFCNACRNSTRILAFSKLTTLVPGLSKPNGRIAAVTCTTRFEKLRHQVFILTFSNIEDFSWNLFVVSGMS